MEYNFAPEDERIETTEELERVVVKPLARKLDEERQELERLIKSVRAELFTTIAVAKREIIKRIGQLDTSVNVIARELASTSTETRSHASDNRLL